MVSTEVVLMHPDSMDNKSIDNIFTYHLPDQDQIERLLKIRTAAKVLAWAIDSYVPICADQSAAMRYLRDAVMTANNAIVLNGVGYIPTKHAPVLPKS